MAWPTTAASTGDTITAAQLNGLPVLLGEVLLLEDAAMIDFAGIPSVYAHLWIEMAARCDHPDSGVPVDVQINGDGTAGHYFDQYLYGGTTTFADERGFVNNAKYPWGRIGVAVGSDSTSTGQFARIVAFFPHYANTANHKAWVSQYAEKNAIVDSANHLNSVAVGGLWAQTAAINRLTFNTDYAAPFVTGSRVSIYGMP